VHALGVGQGAIHIKDQGSQHVRPEISSRGKSGVERTVKAPINKVNSKLLQLQFSFY
jgi:hypothetical protein